MANPYIKIIIQVLRDTGCFANAANKITCSMKNNCEIQCYINVFIKKYNSYWIPDLCGGVGGIE